MARNRTATIDAATLTDTFEARFGGNKQTTEIEKDAPIRWTSGDFAGLVFEFKATNSHVAIKTKTLRPEHVQARDEATTTEDRTLFTTEECEEANRNLKNK